ncbi:hypothetical protein LCGC14_2467260, partial [marine sediment metagenome]
SNRIKLLTLSHEYKPRLLTIRKTNEVITCSFCGSSNFHFISSDSDYKIIECQTKGCKVVRDLTCISEDVKHAIYHENGSPVHHNLLEEQ